MDGAEMQIVNDEQLMLVHPAGDGDQ